MSHVDFYIKLAKIVAQRGQRRSFWLGAVGVRNDGCVVMAYNGPTPKPERSCHAEYRLAKKLDYGSIVYVARVTEKGNSIAIAKPCQSCMNMLKSKKVKRVYWTTNDGSIEFDDP